MPEVERNGGLVILEFLKEAVCQSSHVSAAEKWHRAGRFGSAPIEGL